MAQRRPQGGAIAAGLLPGLFVALLAGPASASIDSVVARAVRSNYPALHACYRQALAQDRNRAGTLFVRVTLGPHDAVASARTERDELGHAGAVACILRWVRGWTLRGAAREGAGPGSEITIPLSFRPDPQQFAVRTADAAWRPVGAGARAQRLLHPKSVGAQSASLTRLKVRQRVVLPAVTGTRLLVVLLGGGTLQLRRGRVRLNKGQGAWLPAGLGVTLRGRMELLLVHAPAGGEQALFRSSAPPASGPPAGRVRTFRWVLRRTPRRDVFAPMRRVSGQSGVTLIAGTMRPGRVLGAPRRDELVFVQQGQGRATRGSTSVELSSGVALYREQSSGAKLISGRGLWLLRVQLPAAAPGTP